MLKFLIVDDEPWQVRTLAGILQDRGSGYRVVEASDGKEALDLLSTEPFDVIITDIRMPVMNGLELMERVAQSGNRPEIVVLSGYGEFQYAQKAIHCGVFEYLLKPVSKADIERTLEKLEKRYEQKRSEQDQKAGIAKKLESTLPVYIEHQLNKWVSNELDPEGRREISEIFPKEAEMCALAVRIRKYGQLSAVYSGGEIDRLLRHFKFRIKEILNPVGHTLSFLYEKSHDTILTILASDKNPDFLSEGDVKIICSVSELAREELGIGAMVGISGTMTRISENLGKCCCQALEALDSGFAAGNGDVFRYSEPEAFRQREMPDLRSLEEELSAIAQKPLDNMSIKAINDVFEKHTNRISAVKPDKLKDLLQFAAARMARNLKHLLEASHYEALLEDIRVRILDSGSYMELKHVFMDYAGKLAGFAANRENRSNYQAVERCKKYIRDNYMEDLSLELMAGRFHFSPSYFSNLFKNYSGIGFSEYLTSVRLEKAQFLLKNTNCKVYDISEQVGYRDPAYFNRLFKRELGISPYKYRQVSSDL